MTMTKRRKHQFRTWDEAEAGYRAAEGKATLYQRVLADFLNALPYDTTETVRFGQDGAKDEETRHSLVATLHRVDSPDGGYIVVQWDGKLHEVAYLEQWEDSMVKFLRGCAMNLSENIALAELYHAVKRCKNLKLEELAKDGTMSGPAGERAEERS